MSNERASIFDDTDFLDVSDFAPTSEAKPKVDKDELRAVAESRGFPSREAGTAKAPKAKPPAGRPPQRRHRTGRNQQLNLKVTEEALRRFYAIADRDGLVLGEAFERAVTALERETQKG